MLKFFNLSEHPFSVTPNARFFFISNTHRAIVDKVDYVINYRQGLTVIYGDVGTGKTSLARTLYDRYAERNIVKYIKTPRWLSEFAMMKGICAEFGIDHKRSLQAQMAAFQTTLLEIYSRGTNTILILDEAQFLKGQQYEALREINNYESETAKLLQVILCGQMELKNKLRLKRALLSRVILSSSLSSLTLNEMSDMINFRITQAGGEAGIFTNEALAKIYDVSKGLPRDVIILCGVSLELAFTNKIRLIGPELIDVASVETRK
jgi:type II secretory pathway predicted ATPase ExeA